MKKVEQDRFVNWGIAFLKTLSIFIMVCGIMRNDWILIGFGLLFIFMNELGEGRK